MPEPTKFDMVVKSKEQNKIPTGGCLCKVEEHIYTPPSYSTTSQINGYGTVGDSLATESLFKFI